MQYCSSPPPISTTILVDQPDRCYLYRAISQNETDLAIQWLNLWKDTQLTETQDRVLVLWECIKKNNETLIEYLLEHKRVTSDQVMTMRNEWKKLSKPYY